MLIINLNLNQNQILITDILRKEKVVSQLPICISDLMKSISTSMENPNSKFHSITAKYLLENILNKKSIID